MPTSLNCQHVSLLQLPNPLVYDVSKLWPVIRPTTFLNSFWNRASKKHGCFSLELTYIILAILHVLKVFHFTLFGIFLEFLCGLERWQVACSCTIYSTLVWLKTFYLKEKLRLFYPLTPCLSSHARRLLRIYLTP